MPTNNYLKITTRRLLRQKAFSLINLSGLSIGLAACLLIYLYVQNEMSYDAYNLQADRIARVTSILRSPESDLAFASCPSPLVPVLLKDFPEVRAAVRIEPADVVIRQNNEVFAAEHFFFSEQTIFSVFSFSFSEGSAAGALTMPNSIVLTRKTAKKYFGAGPALGRTLVCNKENYRVTAVIEDRPANSDLPIEALLPRNYNAAGWMDDFDAYTFVLFRQKPNLRRFNTRLAWASKYAQAEIDRQGIKGYSLRFEAETLADVHFSQGKLIDTPKGNRQFDLIFSALAIFILVIALLNFINLSTAKATERMKEVGVRKAIGARPGQLIRQFLAESSLLVAASWLMAIGLAAAGIPFLNRLLSTQLAFNGWTALLLSALLFPLTTLLAGGYPAFIQSRFDPIKALKGNPTGQSGGAALRKALTVIQFVIALAMLAGTVVFLSQMRYIEHKDLGADRSQVVSLSIPGDSISRAGAPAFFQVLRREAGIRGITIGSGLPTAGVQMASTTSDYNGKKREFLCNYFWIDPQFLPLLHISLAVGRNFSDSFPTDKQEGFLVNEAFVRAMAWPPASSVGQFLAGGDNRKGKVVGVVKDFFFKSLHNVIEPMVLIYKTDEPAAVLAKTTPAEIPRLRQLWKSYFPQQPFNYQFMEDDFNGQYQKDRTALFLFNAFTGLAIFLSCLGLYGLVSLITIQRTKEIGIRKVLGASLPQLVLLLSKDQLWLIGVAAVIALPLATLGAQRWLSSYAYHATINAWMFILPVAVLLLLALIVTGYRIMRAAGANPVNSLRSE